MQSWTGKRCTLFIPEDKLRASLQKGTRHNNSFISIIICMMFLCSYFFPAQDAHVQPVHGGYFRSSNARVYTLVESLNFSLSCYAMCLEYTDTELRCMRECENLAHVSSETFYLILILLIWL